MPEAPPRPALKRQARASTCSPSDSERAALRLLAKHTNQAMPAQLHHPLAWAILYAVLAYSAQAACPHLCSGNGLCTLDSVCSCFPGFAGADCSVGTCYCTHHGLMTILSRRWLCKTPQWRAGSYGIAMRKHSAFTFLSASARWSLGSLS